VAYGTRVALEVGLTRGPAQRARVPSLVGLDPTEAGTALAALGLQARVERLPSRFATDTVIRQLPQAGALATVGGAVRLIVAFPAGRTHVPTRVLVPELEGATLAEAFARARRAGVQLDVIQGIGAGRGAPDVVLQQRPTAHVAVPLGTRVRVEVPFGTAVPDLVGQAPEAAALRVWEAGLRLELEGGLPLRRPGLVIVAQTPAAGTVVPADTVVRAVLGRGVDPGPGFALVLVPELAGATIAHAQARLGAVGLRAQLTGPPVLAGASTQVIAQSPAGGTRVTRGTTVQVAYRLAAQGPAVLGIVLVPDLRGRSLMDAHRLLAERGLTGLATTVRGPGPKGVTGQDPAPGTRVRRDVKVRFTVRR
jgi:serine/threonine-protein kinase